MTQNVEMMHDPNARKRTSKPCLCDLCVSDFEIAARRRPAPDVASVPTPRSPEDSQR